MKTMTFTAAEIETLKRVMAEAIAADHKTADELEAIGAAQTASTFDHRARRTRDLLNAFR